MAENLFLKIKNLIKNDFKKSFQGANVVLQDSTSKPVKVIKKGTFLCIDPETKVPGYYNNFPYYINTKAGACSVSDHIILYPKNNILFVFIIELKTNNTTGAINQVRASYELSKYICRTALRLSNYPKIKIKYRGIVFSSKTYPRPTRVKSPFTKDINNKLKYTYLQSGGQFDLDLYAI